MHFCLDFQVGLRTASDLDRILETRFEPLLDRGDRFGTKEGFHDVCQYWFDWRAGISEVIRVRFAVLWIRGDDFEYDQCSRKIISV